jgi:NarL family two-component system response regulator LiaR
VTALRVTIVNDFEIVVRGLRAMLAPFRERVEIVALETGGLPDRAADIALFDTFAVRRSALSRVNALASDPAFGKVVLYTWDLPEAFASDIDELAVDAVILKSISGERLVEALEQVHRGDRVASGGQDPDPDVATLTEREREVLALLGCGLSNRAIADELYLSVDTVKTHVRKVFTKLGVTNRTRAALLANEQGFTARRPGSASATT